MNQLFTLFAVGIGLPMLVSCSAPANDCRELNGRWANREGKVFSFRPDGTALWLTKFGTRYDTIALRYHYKCERAKTFLDLADFQSGPLLGQSLYGLVAWSGDTAFLFDAAPGTDPSARPSVLKIETAERYVRAKD